MTERDNIISFRERGRIRVLPTRLPERAAAPVAPVSKLLHDLQDMTAMQDYARNGHRLHEINQPSPEFAEEIGLDMARRIRMQLMVIDKLGLALPELLIKLREEEKR